MKQTTFDTLKDNEIKEQINEEARIANDLQQNYGMTRTNALKTAKAMLEKQKRYPDNPCRAITVTKPERDTPRLKTGITEGHQRRRE